VLKLDEKYLQKHYRFISFEYASTWLLRGDDVFWGQS